MSIKITVDNNYFDRYEHYSDDNIKKSIKNAFINKKLSFYPSIQLIEELLGIYQTKRKHLLSKYSSSLLKMIDYRILNDWNKIVRHELGLIRGEGIFLNKNIVKMVKKQLEDLSQGIIPDQFDDLLDNIKNEKAKWFDIYKERQDFFQERVKQEKIMIPTISFDKFYKKDSALKIRMDFTKDIFKRAGLKISETKINKILDNEKSYPYYHTSLKVFLGIFYRQTALGRSIDEGDVYDQYYLIYLTNLDYLVSDDKNMKGLGEIVFPKSKKVINFDELVRLV